MTRKSSSGLWLAGGLSGVLLAGAALWSLYDLRTATDSWGNFLALLAALAILGVIAALVGKAIRGGDKASDPVWSRFGRALLLIVTALVFMAVVIFLQAVL